MTLTRRDVVVASAFTLLVGVLTFVVGMNADYGDRAQVWLQLWLFGVIWGAVGALSARGGRPGDRDH